MTQHQHLQIELAEARSRLDEASDVIRIQSRLVYLSAFFGACAGFAVTVAAFRVGGVF